MNSLGVKRGGTRPGAGRKPSGKKTSVTVAFRLPPEVYDDFRSLLKERNIKSADFVREAIRLMREFHI